MLTKKNNCVKVVDIEVVAFCGQHLGKYKVPRCVEFVEALPLNAIGKVQKFVFKQNFKNKYHPGE
ncbi:MAG: AMP-binding enzyme [Bacillota bacterium]